MTPPANFLSFTVLFGHLVANFVHAVFLIFIKMLKGHCKKIFLCIIKERGKLAIMRKIHDKIKFQAQFQSKHENLDKVHHKAILHKKLAKYCNSATFSEKL